VFCYNNGNIAYENGELKTTTENSRDLRSFEIRIRIGHSDSIRKWWADSRFSNRPCLPIARRSQTTQTTIRCL